MPSEPGNPRSIKPPQAGGGAVSEPEQLPCPRCESTNTKFCYYNNYNFSQPRHFCKSCRRYWTRGGTLRDIPIGGGTRKSSKRSRHSTISAGSVFAAPVFYPSETASFVGNVKQGVSFSSLLGGHGPGGLLGFGGFGLTHGYEDVGFGLGRTVWPFGGVGVTGGENLMGNTWQLESGGDCYTLPDVAISTLGNAMK